MPHQPHVSSTGVLPFLPHSQGQAHTYHVLQSQVMPTPPLSLGQSIPLPILSIQSWWSQGASLYTWASIFASLISQIRSQILNGPIVDHRVSLLKQIQALGAGFVGGMVTSYGDLYMIL